MDIKFVEHIWNKPAPPHDIYRDPCSGLFGECFKVDGELMFSDIPLYECLSALHNIIAEYDNWLIDYQNSNHETETYIGMSNHKARSYWRTYTRYSRNLGATGLSLTKKYVHLQAWKMTSR